MEHKFGSWTFRELEIVTTHPSTEGKPKAMYTSEPEERIGCTVCNMGLEEALTLPCPGRPVEQMLNDVLPEGWRDGPK